MPEVLQQTFPAITGNTSNPACQKCRLHEGASSPFAPPAWFDGSEMRRGLPPPECLQKRQDWIVVVGEPPSSAYDQNGELADWKSLQKLMHIWFDLGVLDRIIFIPVIRCYPPHVDGRPKVTHTQLAHCMKINFGVIQEVNPKAIFVLGFDACKAFTKRGDDFNIGGRVYHWTSPEDNISRTVIPLWGWNYVNRDTSRFYKPYIKQWRAAVKLVDTHDDLSVVKADQEYVLALDGAGFDEWFEGINLDLPFGFDTETTSLTHLGVWAKDFTITCASFSHPDRPKPLIIPLDYKHGINAVLDEYNIPYNSWDRRLKILIEKLREKLEDPNVKKIGHNLKFDVEAVWKVYGINVKGLFQDTMLINYALHPDVKRLNKLDDLIRKYLHHLADYSLTLEMYFNEHPEINREYAMLPHWLLFPYLALDTTVLFPILEHLEKDIAKREEKGEPVFVRLHKGMTAFPTYSLSEYVTFCRRCHLLLTTELEKNGVAVDLEMLVRIEKFYKDELAEIDAKLNSHETVQRFERELLPELINKNKKPLKTEKGRAKAEEKRRNTVYKVNWNSPQQVAALFYTFCEFPAYYYTDADNPSTDEKSLMKLAVHEGSEVAKLLLKHRETSKFVDGFINKLTTEVREENLISDWDGRVHASFNIADAGTGRLTSSKPNMQQIPVGGHVKRVYRSRYEHGWLIQRDYSQLEVRILALLSRDDSLLNAFRNGEDVHLKTQKFFFGDKADKNNKPQRVICKGALFGRIYGQGDKGLFEDLGSQGVLSPNTGEPITIEECHDFNILLDESYPKVKRWIEEAQLQGIGGGVSSAFGFVRPLYNLESYDKWIEMKRKDKDGAKTKLLGNDIQGDLRKAQNSPIQGTAADLCIFAATMAARRMKKKTEKTKLCNLVHDSIWADSPDHNEAYEAVKILKDTMDFTPDWLEDLLPGYDASWIDLPIIGECEIGLNAKDTFVVHTEPSDVTGETRMLLSVPLPVAEAIHVEGETVGTGEKASMLVDFMRFHDNIESYLITKRSTL